MKKFAESINFYIMRIIKKNIKILHILMLSLLPNLLFFYSTKSKTSNYVGLIYLHRIGDFVLWLSSAKEFRKLYPNKKMVLIVNETYANFAKLFPFWDEIIQINIKKMWLNPIYNIQVLKRVGNKNFNILINPMYSGTFIADLIAKASRAKERISASNEFFISRKIEKFISYNWYTKHILISDNKLHELEINAQIMNKLGLINFKAEIYKMPKFNYPLVHVPKNYAILFPGSSDIEKCWPVIEFVKVADYLNRYFDTIIVCGSKSEINLGEVIEKKSNANILNLVGKTKLSELVEIIREASLLISSDTSAIHLAATVNTPTLAVFSGLYYYRYNYTKKLFKKYISIAKTNMNCFNCKLYCKINHKKGSTLPCVKKIKAKEVIKLIANIT